MKKFFRATDLIMCFWQAGGGISAWMIERNGQIFLYAILRGQYGLKLMLETWASNNDRSQADAARRVMRLLGFIETPVYMQFESAQTSGLLANLASDIEIYEKDIERQEEEFKNMQEAQQSEPQDGTVPENVETTEKTEKVVSINKKNG